MFRVLSARRPRRAESYGAIAQLGERLHGMQEVGGSIPPGSTTLRPSGYAWRNRARARRAKRARRSPLGRRRAAWLWNSTSIILYSGHAWRSRARAEGRSAPGVALLGEDGLETQMWYVYILRSINNPDQEYVGATADLKRRLSDHNAGKSAHTAKFKPWQLTWYCAFPDKYKALAFEKYLKSHSGRAFAKKRL